MSVLTTVGVVQAFLVPASVTIAFVWMGRKMVREHRASMHRFI